MHQSPQKQIGSRRSKYGAHAAWELAETDEEAERRVQRGSPPRARKFPLRNDETSRDERERPHPRG